MIRVFLGWKLGKLVWSWKNRVSYYARSQGIRLSEANSIWQREYWDRFIRDEKHYHAAIAYILDNPVSAGLCAHREECRGRVGSRVEDWTGGQPALDSGRRLDSLIPSFFAEKQDKFRFIAAHV